MAFFEGRSSIGPRIRLWIALRPPSLLFQPWSKYCLGLKDNESATKELPSQR